MTWRTLLRTSYGIRLIPIIIAISCLGYSYGDDLPGSWEFSVAAEKIFELMMMSAVVALATTLEGRRYWASGSLTRHASRSPVRILVLPLLLAVLPALIAVAPAALVFDAPQIGWVVLIAVGWILGWAGIGLLVGMTCPLPLGVPVVLAVPTLALLYGSAISPPWISYLVGYYTQCCSPSQRIDPRALQAGAIVAAGLLLVSAVLCGVRMLSTRLGPSALVGLLIVGVAATCIGAAGRVHTMDSFPVVARTGPRVCSGAPRTCVWPEHRAWLPALSDDVAQITTRWRADGVAIPDEVVEGAEPSTPRSLRWDAPEPVADAARNRQQTAYELAYAMAYAPCQDAQDSGEGVPVQILIDQDRSVAWLTMHSGFYRPGSAQVSLDKDAVAWVTKLDSQPSAVQGRRIEKMLAGLRTCR